MLYVIKQRALILQSSCMVVVFPAVQNCLSGESRCPSIQVKRSKHSSLFIARPETRSQAVGVETHFSQLDRTGSTIHRSAHSAERSEAKRLAPSRPTYHKTQYANTIPIRDPAIPYLYLYPLRETPRKSLVAEQVWRNPSCSVQLTPSSIPCPSSRSHDVSRCSLLLLRLPRLISDWQ